MNKLDISFDVLPSRFDVIALELFLGRHFFESVSHTFLHGLREEPRSRRDSGFPNPMPFVPL
jgi:hypothetical protein